MNRKQYALLVAVVAACSLLGGMISGRLLTAKAATETKAEEQDKKVVTAEKFVVVDKNGKERAVLDVSEGRSGLWIYDENGKPRVVLGGIQEGGGLGLSDKNGKLRISLVEGTGRGGLYVTDKNEKLRAAFGMTWKGRVGLVLADENENYRVELRQDQDYNRILILDKNGEAIFEAP